MEEDDIQEVREAIESTYIGLCDIIERKKQKNTKSKINEYIEETIEKEQKCRLSYENITNSKQGSEINAVTQIIKLFIAPELNIKTGSKIVVTQNNQTETYKNSGKSARHATHQEIVLELFEGWA